MELLRCRVCDGEMDIVGAESAINKKVKCRKCGFNNINSSANKMPEVVIINKRRPISTE